MGDWKDSYRWGTLVIWPKGEAKRVCNPLRETYDPVSQGICPAHITLTQPFLNPPSGPDLQRVAEVVSQVDSFTVHVGPIEPFGSSSVLKFDIEPKGVLLNLRQKLHETRLFNLNLPFTEGFIPHMTISESGLDGPEETLSVAKELNARFGLFAFECTEVAYIRPDDPFRFSEIQTFGLGRG